MLYTATSSRESRENRPYFYCLENVLRNRRKFERIFGSVLLAEKFMFAARVERERKLLRIM